MDNDLIKYECIVTVPDKPTGLKEVPSPSNNALHVQCSEPLKWKGTRGWFQATANPGNITTNWSQKCKFEFKDLYYSTEYTISVYMHKRLYSVHFYEKLQYL